MNREAIIAHLAECTALALQMDATPQGDVRTPAERAQHAQACAKADAEAWQRIHAQPQLELREAA